MVSLTLIGSDNQGSVILHRRCGESPTLEYSPYGHSPDATENGSRSAFTGQVVEGLTGHYLLGSGNRAYSPVLMRFTAPDRLSPFGEGGLNTYAYCHGDPINMTDPTGQFSVGILFALMDYYSLAQGVAGFVGKGVVKGSILKAATTASGQSASGLSMIATTSKRVRPVVAAPKVKIKTRGVARPVAAVPDQPVAAVSNTPLWTVKDKGVKIKLNETNHVEAAAAKKYQDFHTEITINGASPYDLLPAFHGKQLNPKPRNLYQIRLGKTERAHFTIDNKNKVVEMLSVGPHT